MMNITVVLASVSRYRENIAPALKSPEVDEERTRQVGDFPGWEQYCELL